MKLLRYGSSGQEKPGLVDSTGAIRDLSGVVPDIGGDTLLPASLAPGHLSRTPIDRSENDLLATLYTAAIAAS